MVFVSQIHLYDIWLERRDTDKIHYDNTKIEDAHSPVEASEYQESVLNDVDIVETHHDSEHGLQNKLEALQIPSAQFLGSFPPFPKRIILRF